jgi:hypothetical protein
MLGYLQQIWGLSTYFEAIGNGMLRMWSWSKDPSWRREEKEGNWYCQMNRRYLKNKRRYLKNRDDLVAGSSAPDDPTHHWCVAGAVVSENFNGHVRWRQRLVAPDEPTPGKSTTRKVITSDDLLVTLLTLVTEWYVFHDEMSIFVISCEWRRFGLKNYEENEKKRHRTVKGDPHRLNFGTQYGTDETLWSQIRFGIVIV